MLELFSVGGGEKDKTRTPAAVGGGTLEAKGDLLSKCNRTLNFTTSALLFLFLFRMTVVKAHRNTDGLMWHPTSFKDDPAVSQMRFLNRVSTHLVSELYVPLKFYLNAAVGDV